MGTCCGWVCHLINSAICIDDEALLHSICLLVTSFNNWNFPCKLTITYYYAIYSSHLYNETFELFPASRRKQHSAFMLYALWVGIETRQIHIQTNDGKMFYIHCNFRFCNFIYGRTSFLSLVYIHFRWASKHTINSHARTHLRFYDVVLWCFYTDNSWL